MLSSTEYRNKSLKSQNHTSHLNFLLEKINYYSLIRTSQAQKMTLLKHRYNTDNPDFKHYLNTWSVELVEWEASSLLNCPPDFKRALFKVNQRIN